MKSAVLCISVIIVVSCNALSAPGDGGQLGLPAILPKCGPVCRIFCPNGNILDSQGCPTCRCKPETNCRRSYSIRSCRSCQYGRQYYTDRNGCRQCKCKTRPESCRYNGRIYKHGSSFMKQCNRCRCLNGRAACTKKGCRG